MALELQIISPKPENKFPKIKWNHEELKAEVAAAVKDYQNLVVTVDSEKDCKETRAKLNKLKTAIEDARKDMKRRVNEPYVLFEKQVKEVEVPINEAMHNLDIQLDEIKTMRQEQKRKEIRAAYEKGIAPDWLKLEQIWDDRWLNVSFPMGKVIEAIDEQVKHINANLGVIANLPDFAFEAEELYKQTLDFKGAVEQAKRMSEIQKRKAAEEANRAQDQSDNNLPKAPQNGAQEQQGKNKTDSVKVYTFCFEITVTKEQAEALGMFCRNQGITLTRIQ